MEGGSNERSAGSDYLLDNGGQGSPSALQTHNQRKSITLPKVKISRTNPGSPYAGTSEKDYQLMQLAQAND